jgi:hypothetical protein
MKRPKWYLKLSKKKLELKTCLLKDLKELKI